MMSCCRLSTLCSLSLHILLHIVCMMELIVLQHLRCSSLQFHSSIHLDHMMSDCRSCMFLLYCSVHVQHCTMCRMAGQSLSHCNHSVQLGMAKCCLSTCWHSHHSLCMFHQHSIHILHCILCTKTLCGHFHHNLVVLADML